MQKSFFIIEEIKKYRKCPALGHIEAGYLHCCSASLINVAMLPGKTGLAENGRNFRQKIGGK